MDESIKSGSAEVENIDTPNTDASEGIDKEKDSIVEDEAQERAAVRKKNSKWMNGLPRRTSKRLAHVEAKPLVEVKTSSRAREDEAEVNTNQTKSGKTEVTTTSAEELESASVDLKEDEKSEKPPDNDSSLIDLFMDPCIEFAIKILTGAIPLEEASRIYEASPIKASSSSSVLPFGDIWMILVLNLRSRSSPVRLTWRMILTPILHSHYDVTPLPNDKLYKAKGNHFF